MAKRINYDELLGREIMNFKITCIDNIMGTKTFTIQFTETSNVDVISVATLRKCLNKSVDAIDRKKRKDLKKIEDIKKIKSRNNLTKRYVKYEVPTLHSTRPTLVLDLATKSTGYCVVIDNDIKKFGKVTATGTLGERVKIMAIEIRKLVEDNLVGKIIFEDIYLGLNSNVLVALAEVRGVIKGSNLDCVFDTINIKSWKTFHRISFSNQKEQSLEICNALGYSTECDDTSDAVLISLCIIGKKIVVEY